MTRLSTDYRDLLQSLLPRGRFWTRALGSRLTEYLHAESEELARLDNRSQELLIERNTLTTNELISDHELELGLPDECTRDFNLSLSERRLAANSKLVATGQQDKDYFIEIANNHGFEALIEEYTPFWAGLGMCGDACGPQINIFYWKLFLFTDETPIPFICGEGVCGEALQKVTDLINTVFCFVDKHKPAHTSLLIGLVGAAFDSGFDSGFDSLSSENIDYLTGAFSQGFSLGYNVNLGGAYSNGFDIGFEKPA